ncbi:MAG: DUF177 domain-containing protein [Ruminococcus sp.]|nr:DUF177 domain-containing protein [Ruminococcus sp.]
MKLNIRQVLNIVGEKKTINFKIQHEELENIHTLNFSTPVMVVGEVYNRAGIVTLSFNVKFTLSLLCDRCLDPFEREFSYDFEHTIVKSLNNNQNDDYIVADGDFIDITPIAISDLLLQLPTKILCKEDCKGLCQHCGNNLNYGDCNCIK